MLSKVQITVSNLDMPLWWKLHTVCNYGSMNLDDRHRVERNRMEQNFIVHLRGNLLHNHTINKQL